MHDFQPYPIEMLEINPFTKLDKEWGIIVAEKDADKPNAMTISWGGMGVIWGKNVLNVYVRQSRYTKELMDASDTFSVCFFENPKMRGTMGYLGQVSGRDEDKIKGARLNIGHRGDTPYVDEAKLIFICKKLSQTYIAPDDLLDEKISTSYYTDGDYHTMYIGEILEVLAR